MFKKLIQATVAATLVVSPMIAASAQAQTANNGKTTTIRETVNGKTVIRTVNRNPRGTVVRKTVTNAPPRVVARRWAKGQRFDRRYAPRYAVVDYRRYRARRLYAPPRGYHWVRSNNDAVLVGITTGLIAATLTDALR